MIILMLLEAEAEMKAATPIPALPRSCFLSRVQGGSEGWIDEAPLIYPRTPRPPRNAPARANVMSEFTKREG